jgi:hypothetical protein
MIALRRFVSAGHGNGLVNIQAFIWSVGTREVPQLDGSMVHVVLEEVPLLTIVFNILAGQGIMGVPHNLAEVESLLGGVSRRVIFGFTSGLGRTSLLFILVAGGARVQG